MKLPDNIGNVTILDSTDYNIFPPLGFIKIENANSNTGDSYGLYWQLEKENQEPIIVSISHEEFMLIPAFVNLDSFLNWYDETQGEETPTFDIRDTTFYINLYNRARVLTKTGKINEAIQLLEKSTEFFSEYSDSWALLAENYYKINEQEKADTAALNSIISNYVFGTPSKKAIEQFNRIDSSGRLQNHPLIKRKNRLLSGSDFSAPFYINYEKLQEAIVELKELKDYKSAFMLEQNYGYLMYKEHSEVRNQHKFDDNKWAEYFKHEVIKYFPERESLSS